MKILKIAFKNINSLEGEHEIDFTKEPFVQNNLFAITGPTGSGKSTILDVIPLALFNRIPRLETSLSRSLLIKNGAILTRGQKDSYAKVQYICSKGIFTSEWSIRVANTGNLQDYEMFLYDEKGKPITQKKSEVPTKNETLIGLNYEQFIKSVMLAQGEFNKFLKVKKEERSALLEQITGTDIYRRIGIAAYEKYKSFKSSVDDWQKNIKDLETKLYSEEEIANLEKEEKENSELKIKLTEEVDIIKKQVSQWKEFSELKNKIEKLNHNLNNQKNAILRFEEKEGKQLILHEKTENFADELADFKALSHTEKELKQKIKNQKKEVESAKENKKNSKILITNWLKNSDFEENEISERLEDFRLKMVELTNQRNEKREKYHLVKNDINSILRNIQLKYHSEIENQLNTKLKEINSYLEKENISTLSKEEFIREKENLAKKEDEIRKAEKLANNILQLNEQIKEKETKQKDIKNEFERLPAKIKKVESSLEKENSILETLNLKIENQNLRKTLDDYRNQLTEGNPCPLCGSTHHPYAEHLPQIDDELEKEKKRVEILVNSINTSLIQLKAKNENLAQSIQQTKEELTKLNQKLTPLTSEFQEQFKAFSIKDDFEKKADKIKLKAKNLEQIFEAVTEKEEIKKTFPLIENLEKVKKEGIQISKKIDDAIGDKDANLETNKLLNRWEKTVLELNQNQKILIDLENENTSNFKKLATLNDVLMPKVLANDFTDIPHALASRLSSSFVQTLRSQRSTMDSQVNNLNGTLKAYQENFTQLEQILKDSDQENLEQKAIESKKQLTEIEEFSKQIFAKKTQQKNYKKEIKDLKQKIESENKESRIWRMLDSLIGDAKGKKFNDFAQDLTLSHLLHLANKRLEQLKSRYLLSQPNETEDDGLMAIDRDMGNQRRSVRTLSGGESFILSLALALALSDLASKNVKIDTLFIDEGFGTLDPETLDKTLDTLERLQQENSKVIGVISHVETLKERISTQIQLSQNGYGLSELKVVG